MVDFVFYSGKQSVELLAKNLVGFIAKYAVDANLFRIGSSILKKIQPLDILSRGPSPPLHTLSWEISKQFLQYNFGLVALLLRYFLS